MTVEWKSIHSLKGFEEHVNVEVSNTGEVRGNDARNEEVKITIGQQRPKVHLKNKPPKKDTPPANIHFLVASLFLEKPEGDNWEVHHIDGNPQNNNVSNLCWVSPANHQKIHNTKTHPSSI